MKRPTLYYRFWPAFMSGNEQMPDCEQVIEVKPGRRYARSYRKDNPTKGCRTGYTAEKLYTEAMTGRQHWNTPATEGFVPPVVPLV